MTQPVLGIGRGLCPAMYWHKLMRLHLRLTRILRQSFADLITIIRVVDDIFIYKACVSPEGTSQLHIQEASIY